MIDEANKQTKHTIKPLFQKKILEKNIKIIFFSKKTKKHTQTINKMKTLPTMTAINTPVGTTSPSDSESISMVVANKNIIYFKIVI